MDLDSWFMFASIITLASISPGPNVLAVVVHTIEAGARGAVFTIFGNLLALFTIAFFAAIGVEALIRSVPNAFMVMKVVGGFYLGWMGVKMLKSSFGHMRKFEFSGTKNPKGKNLDYSITAMLISYSNPKSILFLSAVFPTFLEKSNPIFPQFTVMFITIITIVLLIHGSYAFVALRMRDGLIGIKARKYMARFSGVSFLGFGVGLVYESQK